MLWCGCCCGLASCWRLRSSWLRLHCLFFLYRLLVDSRKCYRHIFYCLALCFLPWLHIFSYTAIFVVDAVVLQAGRTRQCEHWCDCATATNLTAWRDRALHSELVKIANVCGAYLSATLKDVVVSNFHCPFNKISFFILSRHVYYFD